MAGKAKRHCLEYVVPVEITAVEATTDRGIWVRVKETGKLTWLPKSRTQMFRGMAFIPEWLHAKIIQHPIR